jgi:outer membrane lipoprotein carrier protein LolA
MTSCARNPRAVHAPVALRTISLGLRIGLFLATLMSPVGAAQAAGDSLDTILAALAQHPHGEVKFSEETRSLLLDQPVRSEGTLRFDAPDRLEKQTLAPAAEDLIVEGDVVTIIRGHHRSSIRLSQNPKLSPLLEGIRATLSGNRAALEQRFQVTVTSAADQWQLLLAPLAGALDAGFTRIVLRGREDALENVTLEQRNGDRTIIALAPVPAG